MEEINFDGEPTNKEKLIALRMFTMSGIMAFEGMRSLGAEESVVKQTFTAWLDMGSEIFGKDVFCKACVMEIGLMQKAAERRAISLNQVVQC